jgi:multisubunit Na+/H+ antiporter MnhE subunit
MPHLIWIGISGILFLLLFSLFIAAWAILTSFSVETVQVQQGYSVLSMISPTFMLDVMVLRPTTLLLAWDLGYFLFLYFYLFIAAWAIFHILFCRDGAGSAGIFCVVHNAVQELRTDGEIDLFTIVRQIQSRRPEVIGNLVTMFSWSYETH